MASSNNSSAVTAEIKRSIKKYAESIYNGDAVGAKIFAQTPDISFIHPRGHERAWEEINSGIYKFWRYFFQTEIDRLQRKTYRL